MLFEEYTRTHKNFDMCMTCLEDIMMIAMKQGNLEIGKRVEKLLNELIPPDEEKIKNNA